MTPIERFLSELEELESGVTASPWYCYQLEDNLNQAWEVFSVPKEAFREFGQGICSIWHHRKRDGVFIVNARNSLPKLLKIVRVLAETQDWYASISRPAEEYSSDCGERARQASKTIEEIVIG